jgi:hypothetical protein
LHAACRKGEWDYGLRSTAAVAGATDHGSIIGYHYVAERVKCGAISVNEKGKSIGVEAIRIIGGSGSPG